VLKIPNVSNDFVAKFNERIVVLMHLFFEGIQNIWEFLAHFAEIIFADHRTHTVLEGLNRSRPVSI
jgi:hypothetical protein